MNCWNAIRLKLTATACVEDDVVATSSVSRRNIVPPAMTLADDVQLT
jgi:hypothetical protein